MRASSRKILRLKVLPLFSANCSSEQEHLWRGNKTWRIGRVYEVNIIYQAAHCDTCGAACFSCHY